MCLKLRKLCFTLAMMDDSAMYTALADSAIYDIGQCRKPTLLENPYALGYYTKALRLVNRQIASVTTAVCNGTIGTVASLASYDVRL